MQGKILIAEPSVFGDQNFHRSVVILANTMRSDILGFIVNKPLTYSINDLMPEIKSDFKLYYGGPLEQDNLFVIHNAGHLIPNSIKIDYNIFWGGDFEKLVALVNEGIIKKNNIRFFLGYSGWSNKQLEKEIRSNAWVLIENSYYDKILNLDPETLWKNQMLALGGKYIIWSNTPENPFQN
jgi:putative transcriptional regulator